MWHSYQFAEFIGYQFALSRQHVDEIGRYLAIKFRSRDTRTTVDLKMVLDVPPDSAEADRLGSAIYFETGCLSHGDLYRPPKIVAVQGVDHRCSHSIHAAGQHSVGFSVENDRERSLHGQTPR